MLLQSFIEKATRRQESIQLITTRKADPSETFPSRNLLVRRFCSLIRQRVHRASKSSEGQKESRCFGQPRRNTLKSKGKLDEFLKTSGLKAGPPAGLLVDGANQVRPKLFKIKLDGKLPEDACYLEGENSLGLGEAKQTAFPLLGGSRGFVNGSTDNPKVGWKIDFVGKFTPAICFFMQQNDDIHLFYPVSNSLVLTNKIASQLTHMVQVQDNLYRNFEDKLGGFFERRAEVAIAFLHRAFAVLSEKEAFKSGNATRLRQYIFGI
ncbi:MAG: hypothetical protein R3C28_31755 [Pirellulaceae bacterium]